MLRNILLPTDGSKAALFAADTLADLIASVPDVQVTVAIVTEPMTAFNSDYDEDTVAVQNAKMHDAAVTALAKTARVLEHKSIPCVTKIIEGDPVSAALARDIQDGSYDAIAMGSRGMGMQTSDPHYLGSVTEHVIRRSHIPVIVVPFHIR